MQDGTHTTVIGADTQIKGEITFETTARILGRVEGKVTSRGELHIADGAECQATLDASRVVIDGNVEGNVNARERIQLNSKANVTGDLTAATLVVAEGASFTGHCRIGPDAMNATAPRQTAADQTRRPASTNGRNGTGHPSPSVPTGNGAPHETLAAAFAGLEAKIAGIGKTRPAEIGAEG